MQKKEWIHPGRKTRPRARPGAARNRLGCVGFMKRILSLNRWISLALLLALTASLLPAAAFADTQYGYVTVRKDLKDRVVNFRQEPNTNDDTNGDIVFE